MIEELGRAVVDGPDAFEQDETARRIVAFLWWWRVWVGAAVLVATYVAAIRFAPGFGLFGFAIAWALGFVGHALASAVIGS